MKEKNEVVRGKKNLLNYVAVQTVVKEDDIYITVGIRMTDMEDKIIDRTGMKVYETYVFR